MILISVLYQNSSRLHISNSRTKPALISSAIYIIVPIQLDPYHIRLEEIFSFRNYLKAQTRANCRKKLNIKSKTFDAFAINIKWTSFVHFFDKTYHCIVKKQIMIMNNFKEFWLIMFPPEN